MCYPDKAQNLQRILQAKFIAQACENPDHPKAGQFIDNLAFPELFRAAMRGSQIARNKIIRLGKGYMLPGPCVAVIKGGSIELV